MSDAKTPAREDVHQVVVAASFTAEPLAPVIDFWAAELGLPMAVSFAAFDQVFQELLDPAGLMARNTRGLNVVLVRWADLARTADGSDPGRVAAELADAVRDAAARWAVPVLVVVCPAGSRDTDPAAAEESDRVTEEFARSLRGQAGVHVTTSARMEEWFPGAVVTDAYTERLGRVPYTNTGFVAMGTAIVRRLHRVLAPEPKVVVVDADNTLWDGVAGEGEPGDVGIGPARRAIHDLLAGQRDAGRLLCLSSKNAPQDTLAVFREHPGTRLREDDFTAIRVNWRPKSDNLRELAGELGLGLDSFVFIDDSPVECAEIRARCPEVAVLELPPDAGEAESFLRHCWILDAGTTTAEDTRRAAFYRTEAERDRVRRTAPTLRGFLDSLGLRVDISPATSRDVPRVAQLTQRTNQFNLTGIKRTEAEVRDLLDGRDCLVVTAEDRFGSYGQVGVLVAERDGRALRVDTFLLSCRALGRGVEHRMFARLGALAVERGLDTVELAFRGTARNQPAADFLRDVCGLTDPVAPADGDFPVPATLAAEAVYVPHESPADATASDEEAGEAAPHGTREERGAAPGLGRRLWARAGLTFPSLSSVERVEERMRSRRSGAPGEAPASVDETVAALMAEVLGVPSVGPDENFFELGGTSIQLIGFMSGIRDSFGIELPTDTLYNSDLTVRGVGAAILLRTMAAPGGVADVLALVESMTDDQIEAMLGSLDGDQGAY